MSRNFIGIAINSLETSNAYGPAGNAKGEPGHQAKEQAVLYAIMQGLEDDMGAPDSSAARAVVKALEEVGFRITKAPAKRGSHTHRDWRK
mgnify:CR=1 FL=1